VVLPHFVRKAARKKCRSSLLLLPSSLHLSSVIRDEELHSIGIGSHLDRLGSRGPSQFNFLRRRKFRFSNRHKSTRERLLRLPCTVFGVSPNCECYSHGVVFASYDRQRLREWGRNKLFFFDVFCLGAHRIYFSRDFHRFQQVWR
jgi:hypothetical protein